MCTFSEISTAPCELVYIYEIKKEELPYSRKLTREKNFYELVENLIFMERITCLCCQWMSMDTMSPNFTEKTFANSHKTSKFAKVSPTNISLLMLNY